MSENLVIKLAKRLNSFTFDDIAIMSELKEDEIEQILESLVHKNIITKRNEHYLYLGISKSKKVIQNNTNNLEQNSAQNPALNVAPAKITSGVLDIKTSPVYKKYLALTPNLQARVDAKITILNCVTKLKYKDIEPTIKQIVKRISPDFNMSLATYYRMKREFERFGYESLLYKYGMKRKKIKIDDKSYDCFKKHFLNANKLNFEQAYTCVCRELENDTELKIGQITSLTTLKKRLKQDFSKEAIDMLREIPALETTQEIVNPNNEPIHLSFDEATQKYIEHIQKKNNPYKLATFKSAYNTHLKSFFTNYKLFDIDNEIIAKFRQQKYNENYSASAISTFVSYAKNIIRYNCPTANKLGIERTPMPSIEFHILDKRQITAFIKDSKKTKYFPFTYLITYIAFFTGANIAEILSLKWDNVDFENQKLHINGFIYNGEFIKHRTLSLTRKVYINTTISNLLKKAYKQRLSDNDYIFKNKDNTEITLEQYEKRVVKRINKKLGFEFELSDFRYNYVNIHLKQHTPLTYISRNIGDTTVQKTAFTYQDLIKKMEVDDYDTFKLFKNL